MKPSLTIASRNYGSWSLRGWLLCRLAGLDFDEKLLESDDPDTRAELLLIAPSFRVPCLRVDGAEIWDTLAIAEYLHECYPEAGLLPSDPGARAHCRSISGEMHSGFANMRSALPMNLRASYSQFKVWSGAEADIERIEAIWSECLDRWGGPFLFGETPTVADAMYAPVCTRFRTYGLELDSQLSAYCDAIMALPAMQEWLAKAAEEPDIIDELDAEF
ncbi:MAG: glutathione S-transferase family protein [Acidimicrobiales bacterium]